jgi:hypothetical protein
MLDGKSAGPFYKSGLQPNGIRHNPCAYDSNQDHHLIVEPIDGGARITIDRFYFTSSFDIAAEEAPALATMIAEAAKARSR